MHTTMSCSLAGSALIALLPIVLVGQAAPPYKDAARPIDERVADLLARMTIEEKVAQLQGIWVRRAEIQDAQGRFTPARAKALLGHGIGQVSRPSEIANGPR